MMVVNSCCHRAYNIKGTEIQIKMSDDRLVFETPSDLPGLVRPDNIRHTHLSRNPKIAQYLKISVYKNTCKLIENTTDVIEKVTEKTNNFGDKVTENKLQILRLVLANPYITKQEMAKAVGISVKSISANIAAMRGKYLNRVGPDKGGFWEVIIE